MLQLVKTPTHIHIDIHMTDLQKDVVAVGVAFGVMLATATAAYAIPIPMLREVISDHWPALGIWTIATSAGFLVARTVRSWLP